MFAVVGATGRTGRRVVARLLAEGREVVAVGRDAGRLAALDPAVRTAVADLERPETLAPALTGAARVVGCVHARFAAALLAHLPRSCERVVLIGSTRRFSALPDPAADAVRAAEAAFAAAGVPGVVLHPTMIYGAPGDGNVERLLRLVRRTPLVPLPDGGRRLVQPVFVDDAAAAVVAAATRGAAPGPPIVVAGPEPMSYADMVRACARAVGRRVAVAPVPAGLLAGTARALAALGIAPPFDAAEIRRATEDKAFDIADMRDRLGVAPRPFANGLRLKLERGWLA